MKPENWKLNILGNNELAMGNNKLSSLAGLYGTPLFVLNEDLLASKSRQFIEYTKNIYPEKITIHYPFKCNSVPGVIEILKNSGLKAEVMTEFELKRARELGYRDNEIIVNGPCKTKEFLINCLEVKLIIIDSISELRDLVQITNKQKVRVNILLRVNPDYTPEGMNSGSATGSRKGSVFGLDIRTGEVLEALRILKLSEYLNFKGLHLHIGTGIKNPKDYSNALISLRPLIHRIIKEGFTISILDTGGGFAAQGSRELTMKEMLMYQVFKKFPSECIISETRIEHFINSIITAVKILFDNLPLPELIFEPGRYLTSECEILLLKVHRIKERKKAGKWLVTDGGIGTLTMPTYYEYHEVFLCNNAVSRRTEKVTISGPCCFSEDIIYKNKLMPPVNEGEILALMDCGAYFNQWESNFGFMRAPIVSVTSKGHRIIRRRETFQDMVLRDADPETSRRSNYNEICSNQEQ